MHENVNYLCGCSASGMGPDLLPRYCPEHPKLTRAQALVVANRIMRKNKHRVSEIADALMAAYQQGVGAGV